ncbi:MAG: hypothetical protein K2J32_10470 [Ruminococcus sp.]|nr:hypothetical protein [Ruminococcus sp.]
MKKVPFKTTMFFVIALIPVVVFVVLLIIGIIYGDIGIFLIFLVILCLKRGINPDIIYVIAFLILVFQILAVGNFIRVRKKVREYTENLPDNDDYESIL